ncbi:MAG TPA: hypothetical protein VFV33_05970 [Gemmatimonadaceae bacterium]|nr:hypothetical protein [Gemmatimonadaceae bacterium]
MRTRPLLVLALALAAALPACSRDSATAPAATQESLDDLLVTLVQDYANPATAAVDRAGIGGSLFPDSHKLTAEQKAKIQALQDAYVKANAADIAALAAIDAQVRAAVAAKKSRAEVMAIIAKGDPIRARLARSFQQLQRDIFAVYTPAQQAWLTSRAPAPAACSPDALKSLTADQQKKIGDLRAAFMQATKPHMETVMKVGMEAASAARAGASRDEVAKILAKADAAMAAIKAAEQQLSNAILALLTPEQRNNACLVRMLTGR